jgi:hypothetical protein
LDVSKRKFKPQPAPAERFSNAWFLKKKLAVDLNKIWDKVQAKEEDNRMQAQPWCTHHFFVTSPLTSCLAAMGAGMACTSRVSDSYNRLFSRLRAMRRSLMSGGMACGCVEGLLKKSSLSEAH